MRSFQAGEQRIHRLAYSPDSRALVVDSRGEPMEHPWMGGTYLPARELVWYDWATATVQRRFRLRDVLYGPHGALSADGRQDRRPDHAALDVSFSLQPCRVATAWDWTNKEDGICSFDVDEQKVLDLRTPYKTHILGMALAPDGTRLAAATVNDMDGSSRLEVWPLHPEPEPEEPSTGPPRSGRDRMRSRRLREELRSCPCPFRQCHLTFDGRFLAACGHRATFVRIWDHTAQQSRPTAEHPVDLSALAEMVADIDPDDLPPDPYLDEDSPPREKLPAGATDCAVAFVPRCLVSDGASSVIAVGGSGLGVYRALSCRWSAFDRALSSPVLAVSLSAGGQFLLAGTDAGTVELWDAEAGRLLHQLAWEAGPITAVAFAPDGLTCAAGTASGRVIVWDRDR
jgi:WD40 repeat protein